MKKYLVNPQSIAELENNPNELEKLVIYAMDCEDRMQYGPFENYKEVINQVYKPYLEAYCGKKTTQAIKDLRLVHKGAHSYLFYNQNSVEGVVDRLVDLFGDYRGFLNHCKFVEESLKRYHKEMEERRKIVNHYYERKENRR